MRFALIPAGTFTMGSPASEVGRSGDETQHQVTLTQAFYMSVVETTNAQYRMFTADHDSGFARRPVPGHSPGISLNGDTQPVVSVSYDDAVAFALWLEGRTGERRYRLPTEAEWECACRSGTTTPFAFGATISASQAVYLSDRTLPVGSRSASPWGIYDMNGNGLEWCADWYGDYPALPLTDPTGPSSGAARVVRGGMWSNQPSFLRSAHRDAAPPERRDPGFRLVATLGTP
jgi:formylglycine-generating enzyme